MIKKLLKKTTAKEIAFWTLVATVVVPIIIFCINKVSTLENQSHPEYFIPLNTTTPIQKTEETTMHNYSGSIFDITSELKNLSAEPSKQNLLLNKYKDLEIIPHTGITQSFWYGVNKPGIYISNINSLEKSIYCEFNKEWNKKIQTMEKQDLINFSGIIDRRESSILVLRDCLLLN